MQRESVPVVLLFIVPAFLLSVLLSIGIYDLLKKRIKNDATVSIVVAGTDMQAGTVMTKENIRCCEVEESKLPKHYACDHSAYVLPGHKILRDLKRGDPIIFSETDLWIRDKNDPQPEE